MQPEASIVVVFPGTLGIPMRRCGSRPFCLWLACLKVDVRLLFTRKIYVACHNNLDHTLRNTVKKCLDNTISRLIACYSVAARYKFTMKKVATHQVDNLANPCEKPLWRTDKPVGTSTDWQYVSISQINNKVRVHTLLTLPMRDVSEHSWTVPANTS
jgi:hypothetical protein